MRKLIIRLLFSKDEMYNIYSSLQSHNEWQEFNSHVCKTEYNKYDLEPLMELFRRNDEEYLEYASTKKLGKFQ